MSTTVSADPADISLRDQLSNLQALLVLSMRMTDSEDEGQILSLAATAVPSFARCRLFGAYLADGGWRVTSDVGNNTQARTEVDVQLAVLSAAGGALAVKQQPWGWAYPLRSVAGHLGFLAVSADAEPSGGEQFLLRVLAQQIGVALVSALHHAQQRAQASDLRTANTALADTVEALERSTAIHDRLTRVAVAGDGQEGIADALHELTGFAVAVEDRHGNLRAWAGPDQPEPYPKATPAHREAMLQTALDAARPIRHEGRLLTVAHPRDDVVGVLALVDPDGVATEHTKIALEHAATVLAMELARLSGLAEAELRLRRDLTEELLAGTDEDSAIARAEALGYDLQRRHRVVVVEAPGNSLDRHAFFQAVRRAGQDCGVGKLLAARGQTVVVLSDTDRPWESFRDAVMQELRGGRCRVGVGSPCDRVVDIPRSHHEAQLALRLQAMSGGPDQATAFDDLGVYRLLAGVEDLATVERFVRDWLGHLLEYDAGKDASDLVTTLGTYLEHGGNYDATAQALSVHRSTLKYRLQRIREISGHDLSSPDTQFNLHLAVRARRTMLALRGVPGSRPPSHANDGAA
jgi:DNA-binding PucR family transcriptional regulator